MNPYDSHPLDYTGYGPTGIGNAPTAREMRMQAMNRFRTDRVGSAMQYIDPYVAGAVSTTMQALTGASNSPGAARRAMFESAGGQMAMDAAMMARRGGYLGQGDPVNYAANISSGIAGGGFQTSFSGNMGGRPVFGDGRVSGQGAIAERVSMSFAKGMLGDLYGNGTPDPGKLSGFDMEEASGVFNRLARRGVVGHVAHIQRNADMNTRLGAAREGAIDPSIREGLAGVSVSGVSAEKDIEELNSLIEATDSKKLKRELTKIRDSTDAVVISTQERKRVSDIVKSVTEGMAGLADIYGELSAPELQQKLESLSGMRITNSQQARQARTMVNSLRGAAEISGMDPRAFMDYSSHMQGMLQGDVMRAGGFDARTSSQSRQVTAVMHTQMMGDAAISAKLAGQTAQEAKRMGIAVGEAPTLDEIYEDKRQGRIQFLDKYKSVAMTQGGLDNFSGAQRDRAEKLLSQFKSTNSISDPREQALARAQIGAQLKGEWASLYGGDFGAAAASRSGKMALSGAFSNPASARQLEEMAAIGRRNSINVKPMVGMLESMGAGGGIEQARQLRNQLGLKGMMDFSGAGSDQARRDILSQAGISGDAADSFMSRFVGSDGLKNKEGFNQMAGFLGRSGWEGGMSAYDRSAIGVERMAMIGADSNRKRLRAGDKGISLNSIATAVMTGDVAGISDAESVALALSAYGESDMPTYGGVDAKGNPIKKSAKGQYLTGLNFSEGLSAKNLGKLKGLHGGDLGLAKKMGYGSMEALMAASQGDMNITADALQLLQTDEDYAGLNLSGDQFGMTAISKEALDGFLQSGTLDDDARLMGGRLMINNALGNKGSFKASSLRGDKFKGIAGRMWGGAAPNVKMSDGLGRIMGLSDLIGSASGSHMASLAAVDEDSDLVGAMQAQYDELAAAKKAGGDEGGGLMVNYRGTDGDKTSASIDELMKALRANIDKLSVASGADSSQTVEEMTVKVLKVENSESND